MLHARITNQSGGLGTAFHVDNEWVRALQPTNVASEYGWMGVWLSA